MADAFLSTFTFETQLSDASINKLATQVQQAVIRGLKQASNEIKGIKDVFSVNLGNRTKDAASASQGEKGQAAKSLEAVATEGFDKGMDKAGLGGIGNIVQDLSKGIKMISMKVLLIAGIFGFVYKLIEKLEYRFKEMQETIKKGGMFGEEEQRFSAMITRAAGMVASNRKTALGAQNNMDVGSMLLMSREEISKFAIANIGTFSMLVKSMHSAGVETEHANDVMSAYAKQVAHASKINEDHIDSIMSLSSTIVRRFASVKDATSEWVEGLIDTLNSAFMGLSKEQGTQLQSTLETITLRGELLRRDRAEVEKETKGIAELMNRFKELGLADVAGSITKSISDVMFNFTSNPMLYTLMKQGGKNSVMERIKSIMGTGEATHEDAMEIQAQLIGTMRKQFQNMYGRNEEMVGVKFKMFMDSFGYSKAFSDKQMTEMMANETRLRQIQAKAKENSPEYKQLVANMKQENAANKKIEELMLATMDPMTLVKNAIENLLDQVVEFIVPVMEKFSAWMSSGIFGKMFMWDEAAQKSTAFMRNVSGGLVATDVRLAEQLHAQLDSLSDKTSDSATRLAKQIEELKAKETTELQTAMDRVVAGSKDKENTEDKIVAEVVKTYGIALKRSHSAGTASDQLAVSGKNRAWTWSPELQELANKKAFYANWVEDDKLKGNISCFDEKQLEDARRNFDIKFGEEFKSRPSASSENIGTNKIVAAVQAGTAATQQVAQHTGAFADTSFKQSEREKDMVQKAMLTTYDFRSSGNSVAPNVVSKAK